MNKKNDIGIEMTYSIVELNFLNILLINLFLIGIYKTHFLKMIVITF